MASQIAKLAFQITTNTRSVEEYLDTEGLPHPSFTADGPVDLAIKSAKVEQARLAVITASMELIDLLQGPVACLHPINNYTSLQAICRFDIASKVPLTGEISFQELAQKCGLRESDLRRIIRYTVVFHRVFQEPRRGYIRHSAASRKLAEDPVTLDGVVVLTECFCQSFARTVDALEQFKGGQEPSQTGFAIAHNTDLSFFQWLPSHPKQQAQFSNSMRDLAAAIPGNSPSFLVTGYPWATLGSVKVVDIGGADGQVAEMLIKAYPNLQLVVQDLRGVVEKSVNGDRLTHMAHDFFEPQPVVADLYLLRWILHDWPDSYAVRILRQLIPSLQKGARLVINDGVCPPPGILPLALERTIRALDMTMLSLSNSRERELEEWIALFKEADPRFGAVKHWIPEGAAMSIMEVIWEG